MHVLYTPAISRSRPKRPLAHYVDHLTPRLRRMARFYARHVGEDADDLLQEAWMGLITAWETLDESIGQPEQFLIRHARWRLLTHARRHRRRSMAQIPPDLCAIDENLAWAEVQLDLAGQCEQFSPMHQQIVRHLEQGMTWREVGAQLGCTSANVAYHMRQIRARLSNMAGVDDKDAEDTSLS